ncbi:hypothetical protein [Flavobacterium sp.]|uniref:hypothetical protein n=1 Tax=Flavobacterium sp. TaxID=239 RepID=UPI0035B11832
MKLSFKLLVFFLLFSSFSLFSQLSLNNLSLEAGYGYNGALGPYNKVFNSNFSGMNYFEVGIRYMFTEEFGTKLHFKTDKFVNDPKGAIGIQYNAIGLGLVHNLGKKLGLPI